MIIALAGRRIDDPGMGAVRFPLENVAFVRAQIIRFFEQAGATAIVCSAACGADLLGLEAAGLAGMERHIVLPFKREVFRAASVTDRPGDWGPLFDRVYDELSAAGNVMELGFGREDKSAYEQANFLILEKADTLAKSSMAGGRKDPGENIKEQPVALILWEGRAKEKHDTTEHFKGEAERRHFRIHTIKTLRD